MEFIVVKEIENICDIIIKRVRDSLIDKNNTDFSMNQYLIIFRTGFVVNVSSVSLKDRCYDFIDLGTFI